MFTLILGCAVVQRLACWTPNREVRRSNLNQGRNLESRFLLHLRPLADSTRMSILTVHRQWENEMAREGTGQPPSYAKTKKMKSITFLPRAGPGASVRDVSSSYILTLCCTSNDEPSSSSCA